MPRPKKSQSIEVIHLDHESEMVAIKRGLKEIDEALENIKRHVNTIDLLDIIAKRKNAHKAQGKEN